MPRRAVEDAGRRVEAQAREALLREVLPRLLRAAADADAEAARVVAAAERRLGAGAEDARRAVRQWVMASLADENARRMGVLGTDGTP